MDGMLGMDGWTDTKILSRMCWPWSKRGILLFHPSGAMIREFYLWKFSFFKPQRLKDAYQVSFIALASLKKQKKGDEPSYATMGKCLLVWVIKKKILLVRRWQWLIYGGISRRINCGFAVFIWSERCHPACENILTTKKFKSVSVKWKNATTCWQG